MSQKAKQGAGPGLIREWIDRAAWRHPDKPYVVSVEDGRILTFAALRDVVSRFATFLHRARIGTNDRIALFAGNSIEHVICYVGVMAYGATICTVHVEMNRRHLGRIVGALRPRLVIHDDGVAAEELMPAAGPTSTRRAVACGDPPLKGEGRTASDGPGWGGGDGGAGYAAPDVLHGGHPLPASKSAPTSPLQGEVVRAAFDSSARTPGGSHDFATPARLALGRFDRPEAGTLFGALKDCGDSGQPPLPATTERDDGVIFYTSGTTERPKGVVLTYREQIGNVEPMAEAFGIRAGDRIYDYRSFNWASAQLLGVLGPLACGATLVMARKFSPTRFFDHVRRHDVTIAAGNPTTINMLLNTDTAITSADVPSLRFLTSSSAPLLAQEWQRFEERFGVPVAQAYGSSETAWIAANPGRERRFGTVGRPLAYHRLAIVDPQGRSLPAGEIGEVEIGGWDDNAYRYLDDDGTVRVASRGRMRTGDLGFLDSDGFLHLTGREREIIIRGGVNISPIEIDGVLMQRAEIAEAATVGVPDPVWGEEVVSYVVLRPGARLGADDLLRFCATQLPAFKAPKQIVLCAALPKSERGKLDRKALVAEWSRERA
jgi:acyl-coenzyme A synthetase/AMP-(fatty) acid ligase